MDSIMKEMLFSTAKQWVLEAGEHIRSEMFNPMKIATKADPNDLVTSLDQETEKFFLRKIKENFSNHKLFGEEGYGDTVTNLDGTIWIVDPIDGTMNFVHQKRNFCISVGIYHNGIGEIGIIYDVVADNLYTAIKDHGAYKNERKLAPLDGNKPIEEAVVGMNHFWLCENSVVDFRKSQQLVKKIRGTRTYGSAALEFAFVAEGVLDSYLALRLSPWDVAAGMIIVREVGGLTTDITGKPLSLLTKSSVLTGNMAIHEKIVNHF